MTGTDAAPPWPGREADLAWCHDTVQHVSRTFALTVDVLEEPMSTQICLGYLLCRIPDTIEDAGHVPPEDQAALLRTYRGAIDPEDDATIDAFLTEVEPWLPPESDRTDDWRLVAEADRVYVTFAELPAEVREAIVPPVLELVEGMAMFVDRYAGEGGLRIESQAELDEYCHYAAGTVGTLITNLLTRGDLAAARRQTLYDTAEAFGLLLQLVNVATDVYDDYTAEDNVYLPASWLAEEGVPQAQLTDPEHRDAVAPVVERTAAHARSFLDDAETYLTTMPLVDGNTLAAWAVPFLLAVGTLRELAANPGDALTEHGVKVSRQEVFAVLDAMEEADPASIGELRATIAREPLHRAAPDAR